MQSISLGNPGGVPQELSQLSMVYPIRSITINIDKEFGNVLIIVGNGEPVKSEEGVAFVTVGVDKEGRLVYISIEPEDKGLAKFIRDINM